MSHYYVDVGVNLAFADAWSYVDLPGGGRFVWATFSGDNERAFLAQPGTHKMPTTRPLSTLPPSVVRTLMAHPDLGLSPQDLAEDIAVKVRQLGIVGRE